MSCESIIIITLFSFTAGNKPLQRLTTELNLKKKPYQEDLSKRVYNIVVKAWSSL